MYGNLSDDELRTAFDKAVAERDYYKSLVTTLQGSFAKKYTDACDTVSQIKEEFDTRGLQCPMEF